MVAIPGLPSHLREVPPAPDSPADPDATAKRAAWIAWREAVVLDNLEHAQVFTHATGEQRAQLIDAELDLCRASPAYWLTRWGTIFEPRAGKRGGGSKPFIPAAKQVQFLDWLLERAAEEETEESDGIVSKSRGIGASNLVCAFCVWGWLFEETFLVLLMSWKEEFVDSRAPKSLFWKIDRILRRLPDWMLPPGYDPYTKPSLHRQDRFIANPANENTITGETTTTRSARGDRATFIFFDEAAFMPKFLTIWNGSAESTDHRIAVSTESFDEGPDFFNLRTGNEMEVRPALFEFDWWELPTNDDDWIERQKKRYASDPAAFERELRRDPHKGTSTWVYGDFWDTTRYHPDLDVTYNPIAGTLYGGMDPGRLDEFAMVWVQHDPVNNWWNVLDAYVNKGQIADYYASIITGTFVSGEWVYDAEAIRLMDWTQMLGQVKWWGDTFGDNKDAATNDTVYTRMFAHKIYVNRVRNTNVKEESATKKAARTYRGRQEALRDYMPRIRFADTPGARLVLKALQYHKYQRIDTARASEPYTPEHDWTSHLCSALEFIFVNVKLTYKANLSGYALPTTATMGRTAAPTFVRAAR